MSGRPRGGSVPRDRRRPRSSGAKRARTENPRQRILEAAMRLFARHGFEGVSLQRIADEVGLHKSSLFHHYRGKIELAIEVFEHAVKPVVEIIRPLQTDPVPGMDAFFDIVDQLVEHFSDHTDAARLIVSVMSAPRESDLRVNDPDAEQTYVDFFTIVWSWLERARAAGIIRHVNIRQSIFNLIGLVLFYPAVAPEEVEIAGSDPFSPRAREIRKHELRQLLRGMLAP